MCINNIYIFFFLFKIAFFAWRFSDFWHSRTHLYFIVSVSEVMNLPIMNSTARISVFVGVIGSQKQNLPPCV